ncbi:MAG: diflavin oxidoreductase, partial [Rudaea sp.]
MSAQPARLLSPLSEDKLALLARLSDGLDADSLHWVAGYVAGVAAAQRRTPLAAAVALPIAANPATTPQPRLTIVYGSQTGNAKRLAETLAHNAEAAGLHVRLVRADGYATRELAHERLLYIVVSTQGDGDPPDDARGFIEFIAGKRAPKLGQLKFAVLGLGDSSYPQFCAIGAKLDVRLAELGATRLFARGDADLDIATIADPWTTQALAHARDVLKADAHATPMATVTPLRSATPAAPAISTWTREHPFAAPLLANQRISARDSVKDIRHIELSLEGSGLSYEPGDALGVWATNPPVLVDAVLAILKLDGERAVSVRDETASLREWLLRKRELTGLSNPFLLAHAQRSSRLQQALRTGKDELRRLLNDYQLVDLLREYPAQWQGEDLVAALRPQTPRMYSIASSRRTVGDEAHLTVALLDYEAFGTRHVGAASHFLATLADDAEVPVFIEANERFRLPADPTRDVIMIGPGTG